MHIEISQYTWTIGCWLLVLHWREKFYMDTELPFGLRSLPKIFSAVADALEWIGKCAIYYHRLLSHNGNKAVKRMRAQPSFNKTNIMCLGFPLKLEKLEGPIEILIFLEILTHWEWLPLERLVELKSLMEQWKAATKRELISFIGKLAYAAKYCKARQDLLARVIIAPIACKTVLIKRWKGLGSTRLRAPRCA